MLDLRVIGILNYVFLYHHLNRTMKITKHRYVVEIYIDYLEDYMNKDFVKQPTVGHGDDGCFDSRSKRPVRN